MCGIAVKKKVRHLCGMARDDLHFRLRIPEDLKLQIESAAKENHRSMTAEIVARLSASFSADRIEGHHDDVSFSIPLKGSDEEKIAAAETAAAIAKIISFMTRSGKEDSQLREVFSDIAHGRKELPNSSDE